ncbi:MAG: lipid kinase, partial [Prevotellaceae bacterium]|nr:lipid kinase [Prevotellaceae bacterium]
GQTPNAVPYNGMIDVTVVHNTVLTQIFSGIGLFIRGKILNHKNILPYRCHDITIKAPKNTPVSIDGHSFSDVDTSLNPMKIIVEQEAINFIIEK